MSWGGRIPVPGEQRYAGMAIPKSLGVRVARVVTVHNSGEYAGTVDVEFIDGAGVRTHVIVTQKSSDSFDLPRVDDIVILNFSIEGLAYIVGYLPRGYAKKVTENALPTMLPGDKVYQGSKGQGVYVRENGDIILDNGRGGRLTMSYADDTIELDDVHCKIKTEAGEITFGIVQTEVTGNYSGDTQKQYYTMFGTPMTGVGDKLPTQFSIKIAPYADGDPDTESPLEKPLVEMLLGNMTNDFGVVDRSKQVMLRVNNSDTGKPVCTFMMGGDKQGRVIIEAPEILLGYGDSKAVAKADAVTAAISEVRRIAATALTGSTSYPWSVSLDDIPSAQVKVGS